MHIELNDMSQLKKRIDEFGTTSWYLDDKLHREDGPAIEYANGGKQWYLHGTRHREGGPAVIWASGTSTWCHWGKIHREDGPAVEYSYGEVSWYVDGQRCTDVWSWALELLMHQGNAYPTQQQVEQKVQQTLANMIIK